MPLKIIFLNRLIKLIGTLVKALSYVFHFFFPNKRFTIPSYDSARKKSLKSTLIPKIIWQTNFTNQASLPVYVNYLFNRLMSSQFEYRYVSTEDRLEFMKENASKKIFNAFEQLTDGAAQADLWRMFVLNHSGGIYMDIDAHLVWPLETIIEESDEEIFLLNKQHYTNYFIASKPNNKTIQKTLDIIVENIYQKNIGGGVYDLTGPGAFNRAIGDEKVNYRYYKITCVQGSFTNEYFQYIDKPRGKWTHAKKEDLLQTKKDDK